MQTFEARKTRAAFLMGTFLVAATPLSAMAAEGWYVGLEGGASAARSDTATLNGTYSFSTAGGTASVVNPYLSDSYKTGEVVGGVVGYGLKYGFRPEVELSYRRNDISSVSLGFDDLTGAAGTDASGYKDAFSAMGNIWYDIGGDKIKHVHPYVGGGIGLADMGLKISLPGTDAPNGVPLDVVSGRAVTFAYQAGAGLGIDLGRRLQLSLDYRYFGTSNGKFDVAADATAAGASGTVSDNEHANEFMATLRYRFGN